MKWYQMRWAQKYWGKEARERYLQYLQSDVWKTKRKAVLQAAGFRCRRCGAPATEVHHETYKRIYNERLSDLTALCSKCHEAAHSKKIRIPDQDPPPKTNNARKARHHDDSDRVTSAKDYRRRKAKTKNSSARRKRNYRRRRKSERYTPPGQ